MVNQLTKKILEQEDVKALQPDFSFVKLLPKEIASKAQTIVFEGERSNLKLLTTNFNAAAVNSIVQQLTVKGYKPELYYTDPFSFEIALAWYDQIEKNEAKAAEEKAAQQNALGKSAEELLKKLYDEKQNYEDGLFLHEVIRLAYQSGASDLHFQPEQDKVCMRMRKDGIMKDVLDFTQAEFKKYLLKLKFMSGAKMNIDYLPQDGRFDFQVDINGNKKQIDVRVNFMPGLRGEGIVMRFLDAQAGIMTFTDIGFLPESIKIIKEQMAKNYGMILMTGPTGSGKTTTLYSMLQYLNNSTKKIITLEEPVEFEIPGIEQSQINPLKGYTYEEGLKSILRHDPDVILVGEIRTKETAEIALNAALTGHLVLSTLHTNSAIEAVSRLINLGIPGYQLAPALNLVIGQRLVRKLHTCATKREATLPEKQEINEVIRHIREMDPTRKIDFDGYIWQSVGCEECGHDGYQGRLAVVETFDVNSDIKDMILNGKNTLDIYAEMRQNGYLTMKEDAYIKMLEGKTTLEEIRRVL